MHRFEKISNIIKQFKLSCNKIATQFKVGQHLILTKIKFVLSQSMQIRHSNFAAYIDVFTPNTYVMIVMSDESVCK